MLELKNIHKSYNPGSNVVEALKGITLNFRNSEFVSILGPSGCGKTTLLNIIGGLDQYTSGDLIINSLSTKLYKDRDWDSYRNHSIGFVFQTYNLIAHQTVLNNVEMALTLSGISKKERRKRAITALEQVGLKDQIKKKPNQMSGGQMQRVAIARAIVNDPDIILADEPTGALDTETSRQVMDILKNISKNRLIIMVTHNPQLAKEYSTRVIELLDGEVKSDNNPISDAEFHILKAKEDKLRQDKFIKDKEDKKNKKRKTEKTSMSFHTAFGLSLKNLLTKKTRTILTSFAGSIGIIGIALILSLSTGFQAYVNKIQSDTLSSYPLTISENTIDFDSLTKEMNYQNKWTEYPDGETIYVNKILDRMQSMYVNNKITEDYVKNAIDTIDPELYYDIVYSYNFQLNAYRENYVTNYMGNEYNNPIAITATSSSSSSSAMSSLTSIMGSAWSVVVDSDELLASQYDILDLESGGRLPQNKNEIVIVVDNYNRISDVTLMQLGLTSFTQKDSFTFEEIKQVAKYKVFTNDELYMNLSTNDKVFFQSNPITPARYSDPTLGSTLEVVGIVRLNDRSSAGVINSTIGYHKDLIKEYRAAQFESAVYKAQVANPTFDVTTYDSLPFMESTENGTTITAEEKYQNALANLGGKSDPSQISIYPKDFKTKELIKTHLDDYNSRLEEENRVRYSDIMSVMISSINTMIDAISYVLIAFTSISLVVSSIMIGIITYISVLERTKEIGILRSIGARKKDVSRVFNAETLIIGFASGFLGVAITMLLCLPLNAILFTFVGISDLAFLNPLHAIILILISMFLTFISGLIPSRVAAKKDPVVALRTE